MTRWKKNETEFRVKMHHYKNRDGSGTSSCRIPSPIINYMGKPNELIFVINNKTGEVVVSAGD